MPDKPPRTETPFDWKTQLPYAALAGAFSIFLSLNAIVWAWLAAPIALLSYLAIKFGEKFNDKFDKIEILELISQGLFISMALLGRSRHGIFRLELGARPCTRRYTRHFFINRI